jgi:nucleotide-binding universal stress UspA family protein
MIKRVLVAISGTPYTPSAVQHALELAKRHEATVTGVTVTDIKRLAYVGSVPVGAISAAHELSEHRIQITEERIEQAIADFERQFEGSGVDHSVKRETGDPLDELTSLWRYHDMTVFGLRGLFEYGVVHNPDDMLIGLIKHGVRPILAVSQEYRSLERVLIAYNGSVESAKAMKRYIQMRPWGDNAVRIACFDMKPEKGEQLLRDAAAYCKIHGIDADTELVDAHPRHELINYATKCESDLIVMGASSRARIFQHVLGDTVLTAIRESDIPLFLTQ